MHFEIHAPGARPVKSIPIRTESPPSLSGILLSFYDKEKFQVDYVGNRIVVVPNSTTTYTQHFFAGAKVLQLLDYYQENYKVPLFDHAVDLVLDCE